MDSLSRLDIALAALREIADTPSLPSEPTALAFRKIAAAAILAAAALPAWGEGTCSVCGLDIEVVECRPPTSTPRCVYCYKVAGRPDGQIRLQDIHLGLSLLYHELSDKEGR